MRRSSENYQRHWEINTASDSFCLTDREFGADSRFFFFYPNTSRVREPSSPSKVALQRAVFWVFWCPSNLLRSFYIYNCTMFQRLFLIVVLAIAAISATEVCCCVFFDSNTSCVLHSLITVSPFQFYRLLESFPVFLDRQNYLPPPVYSLVVSMPKSKRSREIEKTWENFRLPESVEPAEERSWRRHRHPKLAKRKTNSSRNALSPGRMPTKSRNKYSYELPKLCWHCKLGFISLWLRCFGTKSKLLGHYFVV